MDVVHHVPRHECTRFIGTFGDKNVERERCMYDVNLTWFGSADWISTSKQRHNDIIRTVFAFLSPKVSINHPCLRKTIEQKIHLCLFTKRSTISKVSHLYKK